MDHKRSGHGSDSRRHHSHEGSHSRDHHKSKDSSSKKDSSAQSRGSKSHGDRRAPSPKEPKEMDLGLIKAAESLGKEYVDVALDVPGQSSSSKSYDDSPYIPYYCFMRDREPVSFVNCVSFLS